MSRQPASRSLLTSLSGDARGLRGGARRRTEQEMAEILYPSMVNGVHGINGASGARGTREAQENRQNSGEGENRMSLPRSQQLSAAEILYPNMARDTTSTLYATNGQGNANVDANADANRQAAQQVQPAVHPNAQQYTDVRLHPEYPMGVAHNNPGNLRPLQGDTWQGQIGIYRTRVGDIGFAIFDTLENGLRAAAVNTITRQVRYNRNTIGEIVSNTAPSTENPTDNYINHVSRHMATAPNVQINTRDPATLRRLLEGIITFENGNQYLNHYSDEELNNAVEAGITHHNRRGR